MPPHLADPSLFDPTLIHRLMRRLEMQSETPDAAAEPVYSFLDGGRRGLDVVAAWDLAALDRRARAVASRLDGEGLAGERAVLLFRPGLDFVAAFLGCLYARVVAVPAPPPVPGNVAAALPRLRSIVDDAEPVVVLVDEAVASLEGDSAWAGDRLVRLPWWIVGQGGLDGDGASADWRPAALPSPDDLGLLQYTSGSTSAPKGVEVTQGNLAANCDCQMGLIGRYEEWIGCSWLPYFHDMGLVCGILLPLWGGYPTYLMAPNTFIQRPIRWLEAVSDHRVSISGGPNFAYDLCVRRVSEAKRAALDLSSWKVAFCGSEPIRAATLERFQDAFGPRGFGSTAFFPTYGLAEATLAVTGEHREKPPRWRRLRADALERDRAEDAAAGAPNADVREVVSCGRAGPGFDVAIVDPASATPEGRELAEGEVGEIWIAAPSVARGYWRRPEVSERQFGGRLPASPERGPFFRTGDLGFVDGGDLFVTGRIKELVILDGRNHYPQDLEATADESHDALRPGASAAFGIDDGDEEQLVLVLAVEPRAARGVDFDDVRAAVRRRLAAVHDVRAHHMVFVRPGQIPKTSSGKIQRDLCRRQFLGGALEPVAASTPVATGGAA